MSNNEKGFSTIALVIALGAAVLIGVGAYFLSQGSSPTDPSSPSQAQNAEEGTSADDLTGRELTTTIPDIVGRGQSLECDWKLPVDGTENPFNSGKLWTNGSKGRSQINTTIAGQAAEANALYQNNTAYTWMFFAGQKIGMKFSSLDIESANASMTPQERQQAEQIRQSMIFNCKPWSPDETKFILPSDVEFKET